MRKFHIILWQEYINVILIHLILLSRLYSQSADTRISKLRIQRWVFPEIKNLQRLASEASLKIAKFGNEITKFSNFARFLKR